MRANDCKFRDEEKKECSLENQKCNIHGCKKAIGNFLPENIFKTLIEYSSHILISEYYYIGKDNDKQDSRGGYLDFDELKKMFEEILQKYKLKFYSPKIDESKDIEEIMNRIKQVNHIAFLVYK